MNGDTAVIRKSGIEDLARSDYKPKVWEFFGEDPKGNKWYRQNATNDWFVYRGEGNGDPRNWADEPYNWKRIKDE